MGGGEGNHGSRVRGSRIRAKVGQRHMSTRLGSGGPQRRDCGNSETNCGRAGWGEGGLTRHSSLDPSRALQFELSWQCKVLCVFPSLNFVHYSHLHNMLLQCINIDAVDNVVLENHPLGELDNEEE